MGEVSCAAERCWAVAIFQGFVGNASVCSIECQPRGACGRDGAVLEAYVKCLGCRRFPYQRTGRRLIADACAYAVLGVRGRGITIMASDQRTLLHAYSSVCQHNEKRAVNDWGEVNACIFTCRT